MRNRLTAITCTFMICIVLVTGIYVYHKTTIAIAQIEAAAHRDFALTMIGQPPGGLQRLERDER